jgi:outer membrane putative beta-barrel porin/alpha-amylase
MKRLLWLVVLVAFSPSAGAQDLVPGAYTPAPVGFNVFTAAAVLNKGDISFDPTLPIDDAHATIGFTAFNLGRSLNIGGRYANILVGMPYLFGTISGSVGGQFAERSGGGLGDMVARIGVNLYGAPAMTAEQFRAYRQTTIVGVSFSAIAPTGEYDNSRYLNIGTNRWAFKPEVGLSRRRGRWTFEGDLGLTFFTDNADYVTGVRDQSMIASFQGHLIYNWRPGLWVAGDGNFWNGGRVTVNGAPHVLDQENSRLGITVAVPVRTHQFRVSYSLGAYTTIGGDYQSLGVSYSRAWAGWP